MSFAEVGVVLLVALLVLGPEQLPKVARAAARGVRTWQNWRDKLSLQMEEHLGEHDKHQQLSANEAKAAAADQHYKDTVDAK